MFQSLASWILFIRDGGLASENCDADELHQRRTLSFAIFALLPLGCIVLVLNMIIDETGDNYFIFSAMAIGCLALWLQAYRGARTLAVNLTITALWLAPSLSMVDRGIQGISTIWLLILPIIATLLMGTLGGLLWGTAALVTIWFYVALETFSALVFVHPIEPIATGIEATVALIVLVGITLAFHIGQRTLAVRLKESVDRLNREVDIRTQAESDARQAEQLKSKFLASMSHELRTPLNGVIGAMELLTLADLNEDQQQLIKTVKNSGAILHALIGDVLDISKLEADRMDLEAEAINLEQLCRDVCESIAITIQSKKVSMITAIDPSVSWVKGDSVRLQQILVNLLGNAVKFTHEGHIKLNCQQSEKGVVITVEDTGIGIPEAAQAKLFAPYTQAAESTSRQYGGSGLGLAIVDRLVKLMLGNIELRSEPGSGSSFIVTLPLETIQAPQGDAPPVSKNNNGTNSCRLNVLVADDNATNRLVARKMLAHLGHTVIEVENGKEAVECVRKGHADLILMDVRMPVMDGKQATEAIRLLEPPERDIPIIGLTANALPGDRESLLAVGMNHYLSKPLKLSELQSTINAVNAAADIKPNSQASH